MTASKDAADEEIEETFREWSQGDCVVGKQGFFYGVDTDYASVASVKTETSKVAGLMVLTQTCDIVRDPQKRPFVETSPLVKVCQSALDRIRRGHQPRYAFVPCLEEQRLVADLDRVMTVTKQLLAKWERFAGCNTDDDRRALAQALARKRGRFAFPDEFNTLITRLRNRVIREHNRDGGEAEALRNLREIRVRAEPSWEADEIRLVFLFILDKKQLLSGGRNPREYLDSWLDLISPSHQFTKVEGSVRDLGSISASEYVESDQLDLDHLSSSESRDTGSAPQTP